MEAPHPIKRFVQQNATGVFISTTAMGIMTPLLRQYTDSFSATGTLIPVTWSYSPRVPLRFWRIDYNLIPDGLRFRSHTAVNPQAVSDHGAPRVVVGRAHV